MNACRLSLILLAHLMANQYAVAQFQRGPQVASPEVKDGNVTFRLLAPNAKSVKLTSSDMPGVGPNKELSKSDDGIWSVSVDAQPGYYRYTFNVDGVSVVDPRNPATMNLCRLYGALSRYRVKNGWIRKTFRMGRCRRLPTFRNL